MKYLGFIKWFNPEKGFGFIVRPDGGDVHFHQSNTDISPTNLLEGTALIFKIKERNQKSTAIEVSIPENYDDFSFIMSVFQGAYGSTTIAKAIAQLFKNNPNADVHSYFKQYFNASYLNTDNREFVSFLSFYKSVAGNVDPKELEANIEYFLSNIGHSVLFHIWKKETPRAPRSRKIMRRRAVPVTKEIPSGVPFVLPDNTFIENYSLIEPADVLRIASLPNGDQVNKAILSRKIEALILRKQEELNEVLESINCIKEQALADILKSQLSEKLIPLIANIDYSGKGDEAIEAFRFVIEKIKSDLGEPYQERIISEFNGKINDEIIYTLWQKTRYFKPNAEFFQQNHLRLTYADFILGNEVFHQAYIQEWLNELGDIKDIEVFGLLICAIVETPIKISREVLERVPVAYQVSLWLNFPRTESYSGKHYEGVYDEARIELDINKILDFFNQSESIDGVLSTWRLVKEIQNMYSSKTPRHGQSTGFRDLGLKEREKLVEEALAVQDGNVLDFFAEVLDRIGQDHALPMIKTLVPNLIGEDKISLDKLPEISQKSNLSWPNRQAFYDYFSQSTTKAKRVRLWFRDYSTNIDFTDIVEEFNTFSKDEQPMLLRKTFELIHTKKVSSIENSLEQLLTLLHMENVNLDVRICLRVLESLKSERSYIGTNNISEIICSYVDEDIKKIIQINDLFEKCKGRTWSTTGESSGIWHIRVGGKKFPIKGDQVTIADYEYYFDKDSKEAFIDGKPYRFSWVPPVENNIFSQLYGIPAGITFCDAVNPIRDEKLNCNYSWCNNGKCYAPCQEDHIHLEWNKYSLRDFIKILNLPFEDDEYYRFISVVNRANRLLKKLQCTSCKKLLRDAKTSEFAFYRVTTFHCTNDECAEYKEPVYLNHCLNWRCSNVVDSRISKECPNGWFICDSCSSCCSQEKIDSRYENLKAKNFFNPNNPRHQKLKHQVDNKLGHFERGEKFNHLTGEPIVKSEEGTE